MEDQFSRKRGMMKMLVDMLKKSAADEVGSGLQKPEGSPDMRGVEAEKVEVLPDHEMDKSTPEHDVETKLVDEGKHTANLGYSEGGAVMDKPASEGGYPDAPHKKIPYGSAEGHPDAEGTVQEEASEPLDEREAEAEQEQASPFDSFMRPLRKKRSPIK